MNFQSNRAAGTASRHLTGALFCAYLLLIVIEYLGLSAQLPLLKLTRFPTLLAYGLVAATMVLGGWRVAVGSAQGRLLLLFLVFTGSTVLWALVRTHVATDLRAHIDYMGLFASTAFLLDRHARVRALAVVVSLMVIVLVAANIDNLISEVRAGAFRAGYFLADGNDFGWGLVVLLPFPLYLALQRSLLLRPLGAMAGAAALAGIVGTGSRGATLAVAAAGLYYWLAVSRRKALGAVALVVVAAAVLLLAPGSYVDRMRTIGDYEEDSSAQGRLRAWKAAVSMAVDHPLGVGAGNFNSAYGRFYLPAEHGWGMRRWISAHSVYFKVLGEYGFPGLLLLAVIIWTCLRDNRRVLRWQAGGQGLDTWPAMVNMGVVGYSVAGLFLGGVAYPHLYILSGLTVSCRRLAEGVTETETAPAPTAILAPQSHPRERIPVASIAARRTTTATKAA
ncbi:MAG: hypothetical protein EHM65_09650, partial [Acidobacteriales bacterium]